MFTLFSPVTNFILLALLLLALPGYYLFKRVANKFWQSKYSDKTYSKRSKHPRSDVFAFRQTFFSVGLLLALSFVLFAFNITSDKSLEFNIPSYDDEMPLIEVTPDRTIHEKKKLEIPKIEPPKDINKIIEVTDDVLPELIPEKVEDDLVDADLENVAVVDNTPTEKKAPTLPIPKKEDDAPVITAQNMPVFPGCQDAVSNKEKEACTNAKLLRFIRNNLKYPAIAKDNNVQGTVVVRFTIGKDGLVENIVLVRDIGAGCGKEAVRAVEKMKEMKQKWTPGHQNGRKVKVLYTLPVAFKLQG